ncbi:MAG: ATP-binding protein [Bacteroidia bacterium]
MEGHNQFDIFDKSGFMPHGHCYLWEEDVLYMHVISDSFIALSYFLIPFALIYISSKRKDIRYGYMLVMFGLFIVMCGTTHVFGIITVWDPIYRLEAWIKAGTAAVSLITAVSLYPLLPKILKLPSPEQLKSKNEDLEKEVKLRKDAEMRERQSRKYIEYLMATSTSGIYAFDTEYKITEWNPALEQWRNVTKSEVINRNIFEAFPELHNSPFGKLIKEVLGGVSTTGVEVKSTFTEMWFDVSFVPVYDDHAEIIGGLAVLNDITARKMVEEELRQKNEELKASNKELQQFAYIASHDLKAPLRGISTLSQWLLEDYGEKLGEEGRSSLILLQERAKRMHRLIEGILQYSRIGRMRESIEETDVNVVLSELPKLLTIPKNIELIINKDLPVLEMEVTHINQIFLNLVGNAVKYNDKEKGEVRIKYSDLGDRHQFTVSDNGPGIDPKYHERIFEMFQTLQPDEDTESTGIGLTVVKKIVEFYGGEIIVDSEEEKGAAFIFTLPKKIPGRK